MATAHEYLDNCEYRFLESLAEPTQNALELIILEAAAEPEAKNQEILGIVVPMRAVTSREGHSRVRIHWPEYIGYQVLNEMYTAADSYEQFTGRGVRLYTKSRFFEALYPSKSQTEFFEKNTKHWQVLCEFHIIDVLAEGEPTIEFVA